MSKKSKVYVLRRGYLKSDKSISQDMQCTEAAVARLGNNEDKTPDAINARVEKYLKKSAKWHVASHALAANLCSTTTWGRLRYATLMKYDGRCACCGSSAADGVRMHVDHIKPRSKYPHLSLEITNLQVLCEQCNLAKSNLDDTDWRKSGRYEVGNFDEYSDANLSAFLSSL